MEITGNRSLPATLNATWLALNDIEILKSCIPGCEALVAEPEGHFSVVMALKIGPVSARFRGQLLMTNVRPPYHYTLSFEGQGGVAGFGKGSADVDLSVEEGDRTLIQYIARAQVGGKIAQMGSRLIDAAAGKVAETFFKRFESNIQPASSIEPS
jgi:carbon monoxide dehydrogenase subunit G